MTPTENPVVAVLDTIEFVINLRLAGAYIRIEQALNDLLV